MNRTMKQNLSHRACLLIAACALLIAPTAFAQQTKPAVTTAPVAARPAAEEKEAATPNSGTQQGIKVHGHWVIDVRNPDGTLAQHREFENSLIDSGFNISGLLAGTMTAGEPAIAFSGGNVANFCGALICYISEYSSGIFQKQFVNQCIGSACSSGLVPTVVVTGAGQAATYALKLSGQVTAVQSGFITAVNTIFTNCATTGLLISTVAPSSCAPQINVPGNIIVPVNADNTVPYFTGTTITSVSVVAGQLIQVSVTLSFS